MDRAIARWMIGYGMFLVRVGVAGLSNPNR